MIKYLALDLDGTLTNSEKQITPRTWQAVMQAQEHGVRVIISSGRPLQGVRFIAEELQLQRYGGYVIAYNGGLLIDYTTGQVMDRVTLSPSILPEIVHTALTHQFDILTYQDDYVLTNNAQCPYAQYSARNNHMTLRQESDLLTALAPHVPKFNILGDPERLAAFEPVAKEQFAGRLSVMRSEPFFLEMMPLGVGKGERLDYLMQHLGSNRRELMAFGDGFNDCGMIRFAGIGVAMGNAQQTVKDVADFVTLTNDEDGVAYALEKFLCMEEPQ